MQQSFFVLIFALVAGTLSAATAASSAPASKSATTPDFCQTDAEGQFHNGGREFCGPVALSNSLIWLARNGYPQLLDGKQPDKATQIELIRKLGSHDYMGTDQRAGTGPQRFIDGAAKYFAECGQPVTRIEFRGWRSVTRKYNPTKARPTPQWIASAIAGPHNVACANIGWYTHDSSSDTYTRHGGHWMTITGASTQRDGATIELHDPAPRSGKGAVTHHARLEPIAAGKLVGGRNDLPASADGLLLIRDGIVPKQVVKDEKTFPIIDGVVVFMLK